MFNYKKNKIHILETDRKPVVSGRFYPSRPHELENEVTTLLKDAPNFYVPEPLQAIIVPHAGYVFSGEIAGIAYKSLQKFKAPINVFIIGTSHQVRFNGASIYNKGDYITPLGKVKVNLEIVNQLYRTSENIFFKPDAHEHEHTIEVQLPFLQVIYGENLQIIPIVIGTNSKNTCKSIASNLKDYFKQENLFIVSSDFSHFPSYEDAKLSDAIMAKAIVKNSISTFLEAKKRVENMKIENLSTPVCGISSILTLLYLTENEPYKFKLFDYRNSGDHAYFGDKSRVVGYWSMGVLNIKNELHINLKDRQILWKIACNSLLGKFESINTDCNDDFSEVPQILNAHYGAFVSVYIKGKLRGCIGRLESDIPLYDLVQKMTTAAATSDSRFKPIKAEELEHLEIEISVLSPLDRVSDIREIEMGKHGIFIRQGMNSGTFLPQVGINKEWTIEEFLGHCARDKAGIGWDGWKTAEIYKFEAIIIRG